MRQFPENWIHADKVDWPQVILACMFDTDARIMADDDNYYAVVDVMGADTALAHTFEIEASTAEPHHWTMF